MATTQAKQDLEGGHGGRAAVEAEDEFVHVGLERLVIDALEGVPQPGLEVAEDAMDAKRELLSPLGLQASYEYIGNRLLKRSYGPNGLLLTMANDAGTSATGYDGDKRLVELRHKSGSSVQTGFSYAHDRMDNRLSEARQHNAQTSEAWTYDSLYRLIDQKRDVPFGGGTPPEQRTWSLDGAQNWASLSISVNGGTPSVLTQAMNDLNSYTSFGGVAQSDDPEGNRLDDGGFLYKWDFLNRLREVRRKSDNALISESSYDAAGANGHLNGSGRRVRKAVSNSGALNEDLRFLWEGLSVIQEQDGSSGVLIRQYVHAGLGAHLELDRDMNADGVLDQALFFHENAFAWTHALTDVSGAVAERYSYDAYGAVTYLTPSGNPASDQSKSAFGSRMLYGGLYLDEESDACYALHRTYSPSQGRWLSRDLIGIWGDGVGLGNGYAYVGGRAISFRDPSGLSGNANNADCCKDDKCKEKDDANRECCPEFMKEVQLRVSPDTGRFGHVFLSSPRFTYGFHPVSKSMAAFDFVLSFVGGISTPAPVSGVVRDDSGESFDPKLTRKYKACPDTVLKLEELLIFDTKRTLPYSLRDEGGYTCVSWACSRLEAAGFSSPRRADLEVPRQDVAKVVQATK